MKNIFYYDSPLGKIGVAEENEKITDIILENDEIKEEYSLEETDTIKNAWNQLDEYFNGERVDFSLDLEMKGTEFMVSVWKELMKIPYGETRSYKDVAVAIGKDKACRAVGTANNRNRIPIIIPCHRVIGANGKLVGYGGGIDKKIILLELEKKNK